jgi:DNA polymerase III subunit gamma/tau
MAWYNTYRPQRFEEVIGQDLTKEVLQNAIKKDLVKHAYLFTGTRGVGKTTIARIFANELNDIKHTPQASVDIIEMDAASNTSIDDIRVLKESATLSPIAGKYKIFIIDEVHMLSKSAMNALLKTLEEPPEHLIFLLATTNPEKLLPTVLSRLTKLNLNSHSVENIKEQLRIITTKEKIKLDDSALDLISERANGSQRDAITLLETVYSYNLEHYTLEQVSNILGLLSGELFEIVKEYVFEIKQQSSVDSSLIKKVTSNISIDANQFLSQALNYFIKKSFDGDSSSDPLVESISTILSKQLQVSSIIQAIGLVIAHTKLDGVTTSTVKKKPKVVAHEVSEEKNTPTVISKINEPVLNTTSSTEQEVVKNVDEFDGKRFFDIVKSTNNSPPVLKLMNNLQFDLAENTLTITAPSAMYKATLQSQKISEFITKVYESEHGKNVQLAVVFDDVTPTEKPTKPKIVVVAETVKIVEKKAQPNKGKYFYKLYKSKPEGYVGENVEVYTQEIPQPEKTLVATNKSFDDHAHDMFDFE